MLQTNTSGALLLINAAAPAARRGPMATLVPTDGTPRSMIGMLALLVRLFGQRVSVVNRRRLVRVWTIRRLPAIHAGANLPRPQYGRSMTLPRPEAMRIRTGSEADPNTIRSGSEAPARLGLGTTVRAVKRAKGGKCHG